MDIKKDWDAIRLFMNNKADKYYFASADAEGTPHITPIGSIRLTAPGEGYYLEKYPSTLPAHLAANPKVCILAMHLTKWAFLKGMVRGRLTELPGLRLHATLGLRREATEEEIDNFLRRMSWLKPFKGYDLLWSQMRHVREVRVHGADALTIGPLTRGVELTA
jgi:uncharacterized protein